jgi:kumamolisin
MSSPTLPTGLTALEAAYQTLGQLIQTLNGQSAPTLPTVPTTGPKRPPRSPVARDLRCRNYIKYPAPQGLRPRALTPFKVLDLCAAYNFPTGLAGGGTIGILELGGGYTQGDLDLFSQKNGLPQIVPTDIPVNGGQNKHGDLADAEVLLDIQVAAAAYFYCTGQVPTIKMFFAPNDFRSFVPVINAAVAAGCDVLSISWGADEAAWQSVDPSAAQQVEAAAVTATQSGCVILAASGDNSSGDRNPGANVDMPSSCPHIIGCGGTTKTPFSEYVWGDGTANGRGTGGGYSVLFPLQDFQVGVPPTGGSRMVPDLAANADPNTGYEVIINGQEMPIGGTSAVAPLYSGLLAALGQKLGFITPTLYENADAFEDIIQGSNGSFQAAQGPDPCTGLGVPIGTALAALFNATSRTKRPATERPRTRAGAAANVQ